MLLMVDLNFGYSSFPFSTSRTFDDGINFCNSPFKDLVPLNENKDAYDYYKCALSDNTMDDNDCVRLFSSFGDTPWTEEKRVSIKFIESCKDISVLKNLHKQTGSTAYILEYYIGELKNAKL